MPHSTHDVILHKVYNDDGIV